MCSQTTRFRVYVAGPLSQGDREANVQRAVQVGLKLLEMGYAVFIPHLSYFIDQAGVDGTESWERWLQSDCSWISVADVVLRLPGASRGADREVAFAQERGILVLHSLEECEQLLQYADQVGVRWLM